MQAGFQCAGCGEWNEAFVDPAGGRRQQYVEDCQVCCRPNVLQAVYDDEFHEFVIGARLE